MSEVKFEIFVSDNLHKGFIDSVVSAGIRWFTNSNISHIGIIVDEKRIIHASHGSVHETSVCEFIKNNKIIAQKKVESKDPKRAIGWLEGNIGKDYSESQFIGFFIKAFRKYFADYDREMICSEFVYKFIELHTDLNIPTIEQDFIEPDDLWKMIV